jgi:hypothetical protein
MPKPDNFFERLTSFSGPVCFTAETLKERTFLIDGLRLQGDGIGVELLDEGGAECEFFVSIDDLVDGFEGCIIYSDPKSAAEYKDETLDALRKAIERIERMEPGKCSKIY